jgi:hypothetical protein
MSRRAGCARPTRRRIPVPDHRVTASPGRALRRVARLAACVAALAATLAATGCAKREPPSGGPPDLTPPKLLSSSPDSGRAGVAADAKLSLTFSEAMDTRATQESVQLAPALGIRQRRWSGRTLSLVLEKPLLPDHVYTLFVSGSARDRHGNNMTSGSTITFTTGATFPKGRIDGEVEARGFESAGTSLWCYDATRTGVPDSSARDFDALGIVDGADHFRVDGLKVPGSYTLWAFADLDLNRSFDPDRDILTKIDTTIVLTEEHPVAGPIHLRLLNPRAPATLRGTVLDSLRDSVGVTRVLAVAEHDSTLIGLADIDRDGKWELSLRGGTWIVRAFQDEDRNKDWEPAKEPASDTLRVQIEPAGERADLKLVLKRRTGSP